jgi:hypothetical protein
VQAITEESVAARGVDDVPGLPAANAPVLEARIDARTAAVRDELHVLRAAALDDLRAQSCCAPDEDFVELGAAHVVCEGHRFVPAAREFELLSAPVRWRDKFGSPFLHADGPNLARHTQSLEQRQIGRQ